MITLSYLFWGVIYIYYCLIINILLSTVLYASIIWTLLFICRLLGLPWVDGTYRGFLDRE